MSNGGPSAASGTAPGAAEGADGAAAPPPCVVDYEFCAAMGVAHRLPRGGGGARELAERLLALLAGFVRDIATVSPKGAVTLQFTALCIALHLP
jgi:hypothetical protein